MLSQYLGVLIAIIPCLVVCLPASSSKVVSERDLPFTRGALLNYFPDCKKVDPSDNKAPSNYKDGEGLYLGSSCDDGLYTLAVNRFHCWTDLFMVHSQVVYEDWHNSGQVIDCKETSTCSEVQIDLNSTCTTDSTTWDNNFGGQVEAQIPISFKDIKIGGSLHYDYSWGGGTAVQICTSVSGQGTCTWNDHECHAIWTAKRNIQIMGYLRRSCNTPRSGTNVPDSSQRSDGYYTVGLQDYVFQIPNNRIVGCGADCSDQSYPDPIPGPDPILNF